MILNIFILILLLTSLGDGFLFKHSLNSNKFSLRAKVEVADSASIADGKSLTVKTSVGEVIIANLKGKFYAIDSKCPHLGKSMKIGKIAYGASGPTITCNFHDACFSLKNGKCSIWAQNVGMVDKMKKSGPENSPATVYACSVEKGKIFVTV